MVTRLLWGTAHQHLNLKFLSVSNSKPRFNLVFWLFEPRCVFFRSWGNRADIELPPADAVGLAGVSDPPPLFLPAWSSDSARFGDWIEANLLVSLFMFIHFFIHFHSDFGIICMDSYGFVVCQMCKSRGEWCVDRVHSLPSQGWRYRTTTWWYLNWSHELIWIWYSS